MANVDLLIRLLFEDKGTQKAIQAFKTIQDEGKQLLGEQRAAELFFNVPSADALMSTNQGIRNIIETLGEFRMGLIDTARAVLTNEAELEKYRQKLIQVKQQIALDEYNKLYQILQLTKYELSELSKQQANFNVQSAQYANIATQIAQKQSFLNDVQKKATESLYQANNATVTQEEAAIQLASAYGELSKQLNTIQNSFQGLLKKSLSSSDFTDQLNNIRTQMQETFGGLSLRGITGKTDVDLFDFGQINKEIESVQAAIIELEKNAQQAFGTGTQAGREQAAQLIETRKQAEKYLTFLQELTKQNRIQAKEREAQTKAAIKVAEQELRVASQLEESIARAGKSGALSQIEFKDSIDETVKSLEQEIATLKQLLSTEINTGGTGKDPSLILEEIAGKQRQLNAVTKIFKTELNDSILATVQYTGGVSGLISALDRQSKATSQAASQAFLLGDAVSGMQFVDKAREIDALSRNVAKFAQESERANGKLANLAPQLQSLLSPLNKFGFTMFLVTQNIKTAQIVLQAFFNTLVEGASKADTFVAFGDQLQTIGKNVHDFNAEIRTAGRGLIDISKVQAQTSKAIASGNEDLVNAIPTLEKVALGASYLSGNLQKATENFERLVEGILKGEPELIDEVGIYLKIGNAVAKYAKETGRAVSDISALERQTITLNAVLSDGKPYEEVGNNLESFSGEFLQLKQIISEYIDVIEKFIAVLAATSMDTNFESPENSLKSFNAALGFLAVNFNYVQDLLTVFKNLLDDLPGAVRSAGVEVGKSISDWIAPLGTVLSMLNRPLTWHTDEFRNSVKSLGNLVKDTFTGIVDDVGTNLYKVARISLQEGRNIKKAFGIEEEDLDLELFDAFQDEINKILRIDISGVIQNLINQLEYFNSAEYDLLKDRTEAARDYVDDTNEAIEEGIKEREEITLEHNEEMLQLEIDYNREREKEREEHIKDLADLEEELADDLLKLDKDIDKDRAKEFEDYAKDREDLEEEHQRRIRDILLKYEQQKLTALIDRNARGLFEAERERDNSLREENENYQDSLENLEEKHKDELKQIEEQEEEKRQEYIDAYEERKKDLEEDYKDRLKELEKQHIEERKEIEDAHKKEIEALNKKIQEEQAKRYADFQGKLGDLEDNYREQQFIIDVNERIQSLKIAQEAANKTTSVLEFYAILKEAAIDYYGFLDGINRDLLPPVGDIPGGVTPPPGGLGDLPDTPGSPTYPCTGGRYCTTYGQVYNCPDGRVFICTGGIWSDATGFIGGNGQPVNGRAAVNLGAGGAQMANVSPNQQYRVTLQVRNDNMLQQMLDESVSSVLLEVING